MQCYVLMINKVNIVELNIFFDIIMQLAKTKKFIGNSNTICKKLPIIILMEDFYQFSPIISCLL